MHARIDYSFAFCPKCGSMPEARVTVCPSCNFSHPVREVVVEVEAPITPNDSAAPTLTVTTPDPTQDEGSAP